MADDGVWAVYGGMKALFDARKPAEHIFLLSIDFLNFKLVNHLYGSVRGTEPLGAVADLLDRLPGVLLWIGSMLTDSRFWCAARKRILSRPTAGMPRNFWTDNRKFIRPATCAIHLLKNGDVPTAIDNVNDAREAKRGGAPEYLL